MPSRPLASLLCPRRRPAPAGPPELDSRDVWRWAAISIAAVCPGLLFALGLSGGASSSASAQIDTSLPARGVEVSLSPSATTTGPGRDRDMRPGIHDRMDALLPLYDDDLLRTHDLRQPVEGAATFSGFLSNHRSPPAGVHWENRLLRPGGSWRTEAKATDPSE